MLLLNRNGELTPPGVPSVWEWQDGANSALPSWLTTTGSGYNPGGVGPVYEDDFSTDGAEVLGVLAMSPDAGYSYTASGGTTTTAGESPFWSVIGGRLTRNTVGTDLRRATIRSKWAARSGSDFNFTGVVNTPAMTNIVVSEIMVAATDETVGRVSLEINGSGPAYLKKYFGGVSTTLGTFTGTFTAADVSFSLVLSGTSLTATMGASTLTATLTQAQVDQLGQDTNTVLRSQIPDTKFDDLSATADRGVASAPPTFQSALHTDGAYQHRGITPTGSASWGEYVFTRDLDLSKFSAVQMRVAVKFDMPRMRHLKFGFADGPRTKGVEWGFMNKDAWTGYIGAYDTAPLYLGSYMQQMPTLGSAKRYTATLSLDCNDKTAYVGMSDGQVTDVWRSAPFGTGLVRPRVYFGNDGVSDTQQIVTLHSVKITAWR